MAEVLLRLNNYGVSFGEKRVLYSINLEVPDRGITVLLGPSGTGKSTLLRTLSGINDAVPSLSIEGSAEYLGFPIGERELPSIVAQKTKLMMATVRENLVNELPERHTLQISQQKDVAKRLLEDAGLGELVNKLDQRVAELSLGVQRLLAIVRTVASNPRMIMIDEPTSGIAEVDVERIVNYLIKESKRRAVLVVLHNQKQAKQLGGQAVLLAGGTIVECSYSESFFHNPKGQLAKDFIKTGSCCAPSPDALEEDLDEKFINEKSMSTKDKNEGNMDVVEKPKKEIEQKIKAEKPKKYKSDVFGPRNFLWLRKGELAGTPQPGLLLDLDLDLQALKRVGVSVLVTLTETPLPEDELAKFDIKTVYFPVKDMGVPDMKAAYEFCEDIFLYLQQGEAVAMHCKAGMGRTGTMLVAYLIYEGKEALDALEYARRIEPRWVQSEAQVEFLEKFEEYVSNVIKKEHGINTV